MIELKKYKLAVGNMTADLQIDEEEFAKSLDIHEARKLVHAIGEYCGVEAFKGVASTVIEEFGGR